MANATNAFKRALDQSPKDSHVVDLMKLKPEEAQLKMGDAVSLFSIEANGYLISEGCVAAVHYWELSFLFLSALSIQIVALTRLGRMAKLQITFQVRI